MLVNLILFYDIYHIVRVLFRRKPFYGALLVSKNKNLFYIIIS